MGYLKFLFICTHLLELVYSRINYCGAKMCAGTDTHTFCQYTKGPGPLCTGYMPASLSKEEKARIMSRLNHRRNDAALGLLGNLPAAGNMLNMHWVEELSREAQLWANQCATPKFPEDHDVCRDLYSLPVGQNVASVVGEAPGLRVESMVDLWYMQGRHYKGNITSYVPPSNTSSYYGDFAQMLWSRTFMVGCGRSRFMSIWRDRPRTVERLVCNMAPRGPRAEQPLWQPARPASLCPPRTTPDTRYPGLCAINDSQEIDKKYFKMPIQDAVVISTVLELDRNSSYDNVQNLDEIYLAKLAAIMIEKSNSEPQRSDPVSVKQIIGKLGIKLEDHLNTLYKRIALERRKIRRYMNNIKFRRNLRTVGRPKDYSLHELSKEEDEKRTKYVDVKPVTEQEIIATNATEIADEYMEESTHELMTNSTEDLETLDSGSSSEIIVQPDEGITEEIAANLSNNIVNEDNSSEISDELIKQYLSDPETARELQETMLRMEHTIAGQPFDKNITSMLAHATIPTPMKVRRELKTTQSEEFKKFKAMFEMGTEKSRKKPRPTTTEHEAIIIDGVNKASILQTLMGYLPNMRSLGLVNGPDYGAACAIEPSVFLMLFNSFCIVLLLV